MSMDVVILIMIGMPLVYICIDMFLALNKRKGDTFSEIIRAATKKFTPLMLMISFGFGLLCGHWWWS